MLAIKFVTTAVMPRMTFVGMAKEFGLHHEDEWELQKALGKGMSCWLCACKPGLWLRCAEWAAKEETRQRRVRKLLQLSKRLGRTYAKEVAMTTREKGICLRAIFKSN